jgi:hypothetical protein
VRTKQIRISWLNQQRPRYRPTRQFPRLQPIQQRQPIPRIILPGIQPRQRMGLLLQRLILRPLRLILRITQLNPQQEVLRPLQQIIQHNLQQEVTVQLQLPIRPILHKDRKLPPERILQIRQLPQHLPQAKQMEEKQPQVLPVQILQHQQTIQILQRLQIQLPLPILLHHGQPHDKNI